jgi:hypothetical protein
METREPTERNGKRRLRNSEIVSYVIVSNLI